MIGAAREGLSTCAAPALESAFTVSHRPASLGEPATEPGRQYQLLAAARVILRRGWERAYPLPFTRQCGI